MITPEPSPRCLYSLGTWPKNRRNCSKGSPPPGGPIPSSPPPPPSSPSPEGPNAIPEDFTSCTTRTLTTVGHTCFTNGAKEPTTPLRSLGSGEFGAAGAGAIRGDETACGAELSACASPLSLD